MSDYSIHDDMAIEDGSVHSTPSPDELHTDASNASNTTPNTSTSNGSASQSTTNALNASSASRRPPRKSTLTQQQKNQKRQRATQDQLVTLEHEFIKNPTPTAATRERIASEINMTERSVQIWFQNSRRRAKIKLMAKKGIDISDELDHLPESMRQLLAMQAMKEGRPFPPHLLGRGLGGTPYGNGATMMNGDANATGKVVIHHFSCRSLSIGTWRRVGQNAMDLVIFYSPDRACITYYINNDSAGYKIEFPFSYVKNISLDGGDPQPASNGTGPRPGGLVIELTRPPNFFMDSSSSGGFYQCGDFTEDQQASQILTHHLGGQPKVLSAQLQKLVTLDAYQNRHNPFDMHAIPASAPVSPTLGMPRPASQPNGHFARPFPPGQMHMHNEAHFGGHVGLRPAGMPPGHKRQRSRSVPIAIDFSMLHGPMPTFNIQQPSPQEFNPSQPPFFHHPMPQHPGQTLGPNLQIDTSSGFGLDMRSYPMSATATTPSEFASPGFFPSHPQQGPSVSAADFNTSYSVPFLSPSPMVDPAHMIQPSVSPHSHIGHSEPTIVNDSPPIAGMHRSASADMFIMNHDPNMHDDSLMLSDMYAKQNLNMPMPSPGYVDENGMLTLHDMQDFHTPMEHPDMQMNPFGTIDPNSLGVRH